jgi:hypothetical protein
MRVTVMNMRAVLKKNVAGRSTRTRESIADKLQGQTLMLQTTAALTKSGDQARRTTILGAAGAATGHQTMTLRRRAGRGTGSVIGQVMKTCLQIPTTISATGAAPWADLQMVELLVIQTRGMEKGLTEANTIAVTAITTITRIITVATLLGDSMT